jgi:HD-like signal output (HDOD) protein
MHNEKEFLMELKNAIQNNKITLPTLPEVALRVRDAVEKESATAVDIANIVVTDAAVSARLLQVANSPLYRGRISIDSVQMAVVRLGVRLVRSLVISLAMRQIFQATSDELDKRFRQIWETSVQVAAISRVLAKPLRHLDTDQAMLAGLIHNIGALPILVLAESKEDLLEDPRRLDFLLERLSPIIGHLILAHWDFPTALRKVAAHYNHFSYDSGEQADYIDVVQVARLQSLIGSGHPDAALDWNSIPAFEKIGLETDIEVIEMEGAAEEIEEVIEIFAVGG